MQISALTRASGQPTRPARAQSARPEDQVCLSAAELGANPVALPATAGQLGPLGPVVEQEMQRLQGTFLEKKRFRLWGPTHNQLTPAQAADRLERGKAGRLAVDLGDGQALPLTSRTDLAALEHLQGLDHRPAPETAIALKRLTDEGCAFQGHSAYGAYLATGAGGPLVVLQDDAPLLRATPDELGLESLHDRLAAASRQWQGVLARLEQDPAGATATAVRHLSSVYPERRDAVVAGLPPSPVRALASQLLKELTGDQTAERLDLLSPPLEGSDSLQRAEVLGSFGWQGDLRTADQALRFQTSEVGFAEASTRLQHLARLENPALVAQFARHDPDLAMLQSALEARLPHSKPDEALRAGPPHQAFLELHRLAEALHEQGATWQGYTRPIFRAYARLQPRGESLELLHQLIGHKILGEEAARTLKIVLQAVGNLSLEQRKAILRELTMTGHAVLDQSNVRLEAYAAWAAEVQAGATPEEALARVREVGDALQQSKQTWHGYVGPVLRAQARHAAGSDQARAFLCEMVGGGVVGPTALASLGKVMAPCSATTVEERMQAYRDVAMTEGPLAGCREVVIEAWRVDVEAGTSPARATERLQAVGATLEQHKVTWYGSVSPVLEAHARHLAGGKDPAFLRELIVQGVVGDDLFGVLDQVLPDLAGTTLEQRQQAYRQLAGREPLSQPGARQACMAAWRAEIQAGTSPSDASSRLERLADSMKQGKVTWNGYVSAVLDSYAETLAGGPELDPARALAGRLLASGQAGTEVAVVLGAVVEPAARLTLPERVQEFERLCLVPEHPFNQNGVREPAFRALASALEAGVPLEEARTHLLELARVASEKKITWSGYLAGMLNACSDALTTPLAARVGYRLLREELGHSKQPELEALPVRVGETMEQLQALGLLEAELEALLAGVRPNGLDQVVDTARQAASLARRPENAAAVTESEGHVVFQGVRVAKRGSQDEATGPEWVEGASAPSLTASEPVTEQILPTRPADSLDFVYRAGRLGSHFDRNNSSASRAVHTAVLAVAGDEEAARLAFRLGSQFDQGSSSSSRAAYSVAAAVAGDPTKARQAWRLGGEFSQGNGHACRSLFTVAAALAGDPRRARQAHAVGRSLDGNNSSKTRGLFTIASAIAGDESAARRAAALGSAFDNNNSTRTRSIFTIAAAIAGSDEAALVAHELASEMDGNNSTSSRAILTVACALAGTEERARQAFELASELDRSSGSKSRAMFAVAAAAALNPEKARLAPPINFDYLFED